VTPLIRVQVQELIEEGLLSAQQEGALPAFDMPHIVVERPRHHDHGDYASPVCLQLGRELDMQPRALAEQVVARMPQVDFAGTIAVAGPGYINITLDARWLAEQVDAALQLGEHFGDVDTGRGDKVQVEYVSANPTGPLTIGSARNAAIGDTLANILSAAGFEVAREYYVNDVGSQVRRFGESVFARYAQALGKDEPFPEDGYHGKYVVDMGKHFAAQHGPKYLRGDRKEAVEALGAEGMDLVLDQARDDLAEVGVEFDSWFRETSLYESGLFERVLEMLRQGGHIVEKEDAVWFTSPDLEADAVVLRSSRVVPEPNERPTYFASDIAYAWNKLVERAFERAIYVWGADHHGGVPRLKAAVKALDLDPDRVVVIIYQMVNLKRGGEDVRMSKRSGQFVTLRELLDEVGPDPIRFMLLTCTVDSTIDFDLDLAVEQSDRNPVYYVQYAHARISSILRYAADSGWDLDAAGDLSLLVHESELALVRKMLELPEVVHQCATQLVPHYLPFYAQELAGAFHAFYRDCRVISSEPDDAELSKARLRLVRAAKLALARALTLMGMNTPERM
jgi:arginyl-tRNA synthetase